MKTKLVMMLMALAVPSRIDTGFAGTLDATAQVPAVAPNTGPKIRFAETVYDFGKVGAGELVKHDFVFTNIGTAVLEIKDVRPGCGCTTAGTWDHQVEPGRTGVVPLQFNSAAFGGMVMKQATVTCNDPAQPSIALQIKGTVWKPIEITPTMAVFNVSSESESNETKTVRIVNNLEEPLTLTDLQCTNHAFQVELKTVRPGKEFELQITAVPPFASRSVISPVSVKTSSAKMPLITVSAYVIAQQPVTVAPAQINLPPGPFTNTVRRVVTIRNTGTNSLVLSEASVNIPGAQVQVQETQPGRYFNLTVEFPAGFQVGPGQQVEVSVKSNHPKHPLITVPVIQPQHAAAAAVPGVSTSAQIVPAKTPPPGASGK